MKHKGFTLIELLVVISIIGVLSTMVMSSLNNARDKAQETSIKTTLKNLQTSAMMYLIDNDTFAGLCNYSNNTVHVSIQPFVDKLKSIAGDSNVKCIVRTSNVPASAHFVAADQLERKNFGVAVYYNQRHYGVDSQGIMTFDTTNTGSAVDWQVAKQRCADVGKRLPPVEVMKAINDYGAQGGNLSFSSYHHWTNTPSATSASLLYTTNFSNGGVNRVGISGAMNAPVRCVF